MRRIGLIQKAILGEKTVVAALSAAPAVFFCLAVTVSRTLFGGTNTRIPS